MVTSGHILVDFDGTLAQYISGYFAQDKDGPPVIPMLERVRKWVKDGVTVKIFTARVCGPKEEADHHRKKVQDWLESHGLPRLEVVNYKTWSTVAIYDDIAFRIIKNTGEVVGE